MTYEQWAEAKKKLAENTKIPDYYAALTKLDVWPLQVRHVPISRVEMPLGVCIFTRLDRTIVRFAWQRRHHASSVPRVRRCTISFSPNKRIWGRILAKRSRIYFTLTGRSTFPISVEL